MTKLFKIFAATAYGVGSRPIGPPDTAVPAHGKNPAGDSKAKRKRHQDDPHEGGKKQ
jgi:hypothetical protein